MRNLPLLLLLLLCFAAGAQQPLTVKGTVVDTAGQPLSGVTIKYRTDLDSAFSISDKSGAFSFSRKMTANFWITATYTGLRSFEEAYAVNNRTIFQIPPIMLVPASAEMDSILITSIRPVLVKEDTVQFDARAYKVREGAPVEDVIKKLPGVTVDKDGNIETQGKKVTRVRVNGKDFFGGDVQTATQNLPAEVIENIQIIDDYGDQANLTGIKNGEPEKIININTQRNRNRGNFGNATAAVGNEGRFAGNIFVNNFHDERQMSVLGAINNTNANLFNFNGGGRGGGARGANLGSESRGGSGGAGITLSKSIGLNYRDKWGENISVYGSYSFSSRSTDITSSTFSQDINPQNIRNTQRESKSSNSSYNHRLTWNVEYAMDSLNYIKVSPYASYSSSDNAGRSRSEISRAKYYTLNNSISFSDSKSPSAGGSILYNHKFGRRGRNFSANMSFDFSDNEGDRYSNNAYQNIDSNGGLSVRDTTQMQSIYTQSKNNRSNVRLSYAEPLNANATTFLELNYDWNKSTTESVREVNDLQDSAGKVRFFNDDQSNHYNYSFTTNRASLTLKGRSEKYNYNVGIQAQPSS
ncbi:MAG: TonB-dependent receptor, partial [Chitinophagaceae bacterium]